MLPVFKTSFFRPVLLPFSFFEPGDSYKKNSYKKNDIPSISNFFPGPLNISTKYTIIFFLYLELFSALDKYFGPVATNLSLTQTF